MDTHPQDPNPSPLAGVAGETLTGSPVPIGLSTVVGLSTAGVAGGVAAVTAFLSGDHSAETIGAMIAGAIVLYGVIRGRSDQAAARALPAGAALPLAPSTTINLAGPSPGAPDHGATSAPAPSERALATADVDGQAELSDVDGDLGDEDQPAAADLEAGPVDLDDRQALADPVDDEPGAAR